MLLESPRFVKYPWTVTAILRNRAEEVEKGTALFSYSVKQLAPEYDADGVESMVEKTLVLRFESTTEGSIAQWRVQKGEVIERPGVLLVDIKEPCTHEVQYGGMCANCGKNMTERDYTTTKLDVDRAGVSMAHSSMQLKVSKDQAAKQENDAKRRLLHSRRLSLVVDLDQTVLQATVDPTVVEWQSDPENPNYEAVKDVRSFELAEVGVDGRIKRKASYHIKLRPGLEEFLQNMCKLYELHIYTMGTREYAREIAKLIDPDRKIFGDRILSRDENGIPNAKSLQRLFPNDTKMVVIIDDRVDVWNWIDNQVKVKPYDFFVGIGDIHGRFAGPAAKGPKIVPKLTNPIKNGAQTTNVLLDTPGKDSEGVSMTDTTSITASNIDLVTLEQKTAEQDEALFAQVTDRPLLQKQQILDQEEEDAKSHFDDNSEDDDEHPKHRHNLLTDDDVELFRLEEILQNIHTDYYDAYERNRAKGHGLRVNELRGERITKKRPVDDMEHLPDVKDVMVALKKATFGDVNLTISGLWAQQIKVLDTDLGYWATRFGATINAEITGESTHLITKPGMNTAKVKLARKHRVKVLTEKWLYDSVNQWKKLDETPYLIDFGSNSDADNLAELEALQDEAGASDDGGASDMDVLEGFLASEAVPAADQDTLQSPVLSDMGDIFASALDDLEDEDEGSEDGSAASDTDNYDSDASDQTDPGKKRKRDNESAENTDADDSDAPTKSNRNLGSDLQRRKRKAFERVSSLTQIVDVPDSQASQTAPIVASGKAISTEGLAVAEAMDIEDRDDNDDDAAFAAAFELELEQLTANTDEGEDDVV